MGLVFWTVVEHYRFITWLNNAFYRKIPENQEKIHWLMTKLNGVWHLIKTFFVWLQLGWIGNHTLPTFHFFSRQVVVMVEICVLTWARFAQRWGSSTRVSSRLPSHFLERNEHLCDSYLNLIPHSQRIRRITQVLVTRISLSDTLCREMVYQGDIGACFNLSTHSSEVCWGHDRLQNDSEWSFAKVGVLSIEKYLLQRNPCCWFAPTKFVFPIVMKYTLNISLLFFCFLHNSQSQFTFGLGRRHAHDLENRSMHALEKKFRRCPWLPNTLFCLTCYFLKQSTGRIWTSKFVGNILKQCKSYLFCIPKFFISNTI